MKSLKLHRMPSTQKRRAGRCQANVKVNTSHRMSGQNKTFNSTNMDGPAILRWNTELELLILVVGGAAHVFY